MKNVLVITYYWPPAGGPGVQRTLKFVKYMRKFDWNPIVLIPENADYPVHDKSLFKDTENIDVYRNDFFEPHQIYKKIKGMNPEDSITTTILTDKSNSFIDKLSKWIRLNLFIPDARMSWIFGNKKQIKDIFSAHKIDLIFSSGPPHTVHLVAKNISKKYAIPNICDFRDPWTDFVSYQENKRFILSEMIDKYLEKNVLSSANELIVISPSMKNLYTKYKSSDKINVITNGFDEDDLSKKQIEYPKEFLWTYTGNLDKNRVPYSFLTAISELKRKSNINVKCQFVGRQCQELIDEIIRLNIEDICIIEGFIPHSESIKRLEKSYGLILVIDDVPNNESFLTGKIFEYIGSQKTIIGVGPIGGDASKILQESESGEMFDYSDSERIYSFLTDEYELFLKKENRKTNREKYTRENLTKQLCHLFDKVSQ